MNLPQGGELLIILLVVAVVFGASRLPKLARSVGQAKGEFEKGLREGKDKVEAESAADGDADAALAKAKAEAEEAVAKAEAAKAALAQAEAAKAHGANGTNGATRETGADAKADD